MVQPSSMRTERPLNVFTGRRRKANPWRHFMNVNLGYGLVRRHMRLVRMPRPSLPCWNIASVLQMFSPPHTAGAFARLRKKRNFLAAFHPPAYVSNARFCFFFLSRFDTSAQMRRHARYDETLVSSLPWATLSSLFLLRTTLSSNKVFVPSVLPSWLWRV